jgi:predicted DCC family thiol-disulfide oxidoreductase YuxK
MRKPLVLFDDKCLLCNGAVQWLLKVDRDAVFSFGFLSSYLEKYGVSSLDGVSVKGDSLVLVLEEGVFLYSTAALKIAERLPLPWRLLSYLRWVPLGIRDGVYHFVALRRKAWWGEQEKCWLPEGPYKDRFWL